MTRVQFTYDIDDLEDAHRRLGFRSPHDDLRTRTLATGLVVLIGAPALVLWGRDRFPDASLGLLVAAPILLFLRILRLKSSRRATRNLLRATQSGDGPWVCEVELREEGVWTRRGLTEILWGWPEVSSIQASEETIDFKCHSPGSGLVVRNRAFASPSEKQAFLVEAQSLRSRARSRSSDAGRSTPG